MIVNKQCNVCIHRHGLPKKATSRGDFKCEASGYYVRKLSGVGAKGLKKGELWLPGINLCQKFEQEHKDCNTCKHIRDLKADKRGEFYCERASYMVEQNCNKRFLIPAIYNCENWEPVEGLGGSKQGVGRVVESKERVKLKRALRRKGIPFNNDDKTAVLEAKLKDGGFMSFSGG